MQFKPEDFDFEDWYETGIECPTWVFSHPKESADFSDWRYIISKPYNSFASDNPNKNIYRVEIIDEVKHSTKTFYEGNIPTHKFAQELFVNLQMQYITSVRRELNLENILNKSKNR